MKLNVQSVEYNINNGKPIIHLFGRDKKGKRHLVKYKDFKPYFYVPKYDDVPNLRQIDKVIYNNKISIFGDELKKIYTKVPWQVKELRDKFTQTFESDVLFSDRFLIDNKIKSGFDTEKMKSFNTDFGYPRVCFFDIETDTKYGFFKGDDPQGAITCITLYDNYTKKYITTVWRKDLTKCRKVKKVKSKITGKSLDWAIFQFDNEKSMLKKFISVMRRIDPDVLSGWNCDKFDTMFVINRCKKLDLAVEMISPMDYVKANKYGPFYSIKIPGRNIFDLMTAYKKLQPSELDSFSLDSVSEKELKTGKLKEGVNTWRTDLKKHIDYNLVDVELCVEIDKKNNIIGFYDQLRKMAGCEISDTLRIMKMIDMNTLHFVHDYFVLPTMIKGKKKKFKGAVVQQPVPGIHPNVIVLDLKSLYPSIARSCNMSPETVDELGDIKLGNGVSFDSEVKGVLPKLLDELDKERARTKAEKQKHPYKSEEWKLADAQDRSIKTIMNSYYGVVSNPAFRLFEIDVARSITWFGRKIIKLSRKIIEKMGYKVIYGDTDSIFILSGLNNKEDIIELGNKLAKTLNKKYDKFMKKFGVKENKIVIEFEKIFEKLYFSKVKKRYAGKLMWIDGKDSNKIIKMGLDSKRSDNSKLSKDLQNKIINMLLGDLNNKEILKVIKEKVDMVKDKEIDIKELGIPKGIKKPLEAYVKQRSPWIVGSEYSNEHLGTDFREGTKPRLLYVKDVKKYPSTEVVCFESDEELKEIRKHFIIDYDLMVDKVIKAKVDTILEDIGFSWEDIKTCSTQNKMGFY